MTLKELFNEFNFKLVWEEDEYFGGNRYTRPFRIAGYFIKGMYRRLVCAVVGHDMHDDGYAGPDSGCVDVNCHRCGYSAGRHYLY